MRYLRRYTELPFVIDYLQRKRLTLLSPESWDDRNDSFYIEQYVKASKIKQAYALCLSETGETYHHWKVFSSGTSGACIRFRREIFEDYVSKVPNLRAESVQYRKIDELRTKTPEDEELPFLKRIAFEAEKEFRLIYDYRKSTTRIVQIPMPLDSVDRIILSPWLTKNVAKHVGRTLKSIEGCSDINVSRSSLIENEGWKGFVRNDS